VRAEAAERGFSVASKPDSHDICFIPDGDTRGWLAERVGAEKGTILERDGSVVGTHEGAHAFTVGQRRGLSLGVPSPDGRPRFVLEVRPKDNTVVVGPKEALDIAEISGIKISWAGLDPVQSGLISEAGIPFECEVQIRAHADPVPAMAVQRDGELIVTPHVPLNGVAPGQTAVIYVGTRVLGQCTIDRTVSAVPVPAAVPVGANA